MSTPLQQKTRQRKMIYFGAIVVLFTLSLMHREFIVKPQAYRLQLREEARGDVELTSSAVRLVLIGSRGVAVTMLWYNAMDKQKRNEWHEMELIVKSITKLQPYFITPWLYQSWNISFNVAVECDRPRDKYFYIGRGLELLAEGERRNRGSEESGGATDPNRVKYPGNPEMRHYMGFFYQLKIGTSDERLTMRSLLELSCIDPVERTPDRFWTTDDKGRKDVNTTEFIRFAHKYPRTVRRLREQLDYDDPRRIVQFLADYQDIPNRYKPVDKSKLEQVEKSELKDPLEQFPILPPPEEDWPNPKDYELTRESIDVFLVSRTWYQFAQKPLPPPDDNPRPIGQDHDKSRYRVPKQMVTQLFRQYPARAQIYVAETIEQEGFIDGEGWNIFDPRNFEHLANRFQGRPEFVGQEPKHQSRLAWDKGYEMYKEFGRANGLYFSPNEIQRLNEAANKLARQPLAKGGLGLRAEEPVNAIPAEWRVGERWESLNAHLKLYYAGYFRRLTNFDAFFYQAEGEKDRITAAARKLLFDAERERKTRTLNEETLNLYNRAWELYVWACFKYPRFAQVTAMQEELCEVHQRYLEAGQRLHREAFKNRAVIAAKIGFSPYAMEAGSRPFHTPQTLAELLAFWPPSDWRGAIAAQAFHRDNLLDDAGTLVAQLAYWPLPNWRETIVRYHIVSTKEQDKQQMLKVVPIPTRLGPLDVIEYMDTPATLGVKETLARWTVGAALCSSFASPLTAIPHPAHEYFLLSRVAPAAGELPPDGWRQVITGESRRIAADRLGLNR